MLKGERIAEGRTAEVFRWGETEVLKLFHPEWDRRSVEREADTTARVHAVGAPVPAVRGVIEVDGRCGILFERVDGPTMGAMLRPTNLVSYARHFAELHADLHERCVGGLPSLRVRLATQIGEAAEKIGDHATEAEEVLAELPEGDALCHGDFHPYNVLLSTEGPVVIDWHDATTGNPFADVARTCLLIGNAPLHHEGRVGRGLARVAAGTFLTFYLGRYFELRPGSREDINVWTLPVVAARLSENVREEETALRRLVEGAVSRWATSQLDR